MKKLSLIIAAIMVIAVTIVKAPTLTSMASSQDSWFAFNITPSNSPFTKPRPKENATSSYMYCTSCTSSYISDVWGGEVDGGLHSCSMGYRYYFATNYKRFMYNNVYELGYDLCAISADPSVTNVTASGWWSPDSVYEAGVSPASDYIH